MTSSFLKPSTLAFCIALALTVAVYWTGLFGPLLFDDFWNLTPIEKWFNGEESLQAAILPNRDSIIYSRPVAMASFALTSWLGGNTIFALKLGNLALHLAIGILCYRLALHVMRLDSRLRDHAAPLAAFLAAVWLLHPLHVSTVLYGVQRMAQLSTFFTLCCVMVYLNARDDVTRDKTTRAKLKLFFVFPLMLAAGILSKQNAVAAPLMCVVMELAFYAKDRRPGFLQVFLAIFAFVPAAGGIALLAIAPDRLLGGYAELEFTLAERLLTQPRVLLDYIAAWFLPRTPAMGLYTDGYVVSTGLVAPPFTLIAIALLTSATIAAVALRKENPTIFAGWGLFLCGHVVESSFLPLEMYYEHRNYLPSIGLLLAAASVAGRLLDKPRETSSRFYRIVPVIGVLMAGVLAFGTAGRSSVWRDEYLMTAQGLRHQPSSIRVHLDRLSLEIKRKDYVAARKILDAMQNSGDQRKRVVAGLDIAALDCLEKGVFNPDGMDAGREAALPRLTVSEVHSALFLLEVATKKDCGVEFSAHAAQTLSDIVDAASEQPAKANNKASIRRVSSQLFAISGDWPASNRQAGLGWSNFPTLPLGSMLAVSSARIGNFSEAKNTLAEMDKMVRSTDKVWKLEMRRLHEMVDAAEAAATAH